MAEHLSISIYKQEPGADIEPGWYAVIFRTCRGPSLSDRWLGPYPTKRKAEQAGRPHDSDHLYKAGARGVRSGGSTVEEVRAWARGQGLSPDQIEHVVEGAKDEIANGRRGKGRLGK